MCSTMYKKYLFTTNRRYLNISVASQEYRVTVPEESVIVSNSGFLKCSIPSFAADFLQVVGWTSSEGVEFLPGNHFGKFPSSL